MRRGLKDLDLRLSGERGLTCVNGNTHDLPRICAATDKGERNMFHNIQCTPYKGLSWQHVADGGLGCDRKVQV